MDKLRVLCLDIEGGHGGSSRSLYQSVRALDRNRVDVEVWCRRNGAILSDYRDIGVPARHCPDMPRFTTLVRNSRSAIDLVRFFLDQWPKSKSFRGALEEAFPRVDVIHLNHISLFWLARWISRRPSRPRVVLHVRTNPYDTVFGRWQQRIAVRHVDGLVFITENERAHMARLCGRPIDGPVIFNPADTPDNVPPFSDLAPEGRFVVAVLSNYSYLRGIDRLIEIAKCLDSRGDNRIAFVVAGDMALSAGLPGRLGEIGARGGTLEDYAAEVGVSARIRFVGHTTEPERILAAADVLLKPTREANPWGRDILEALAQGVPVASVGSYDRFVETGETGFLQAEFDPDGMADWLVEIASRRDLAVRMGERARARIRALCDPRTQAAALQDFWRTIVESGRS